MGEYSNSAELGALVGSLGVVWVIAMVVCVFSIVCTWKIFSKMGEPGWASLIPWYNTWILCKHTWGSGAMMFTWLIPAAGSILMLITYWRLFKGFGKSTGFCILGLLFQPICMAICAFDSSDFSDQA